VKTWKRDEITRHMQPVGEVMLYYATCSLCGGAWVKNRWGQFVWETRSNRDAEVLRHQEEHHGSCKAA
jgi:hypothetical protein